jgi:hypothetical protein
MIIPTTEVRVLVIMSTSLTEGTKLAKLEVKRRKTSCVTPIGI